jgi:uncharacterized protein YjgD (DUF1641 family)
MSYVLARRIKNEIDSAIKTDLSSVPSINTLVDLFPLSEIIEQETSGGQKERLRQLLSCRAAAEQALANPGHRDPNNEILRTFRAKVTKDIAEKLIKSELSDYYYLHQIDASSTSDLGFVALLRHVRTLPARFADSIANGLEADAVATQNDVEVHFSFAHDPICLVTGELTSPFIEHFMQHFTRLWSDIGLDDYEPHVIADAQKLAVGATK